MNSTDKRRYTQIGIDRLVRLKWLGITADLALVGNPSKDVKSILQKEIAESFRSPNVNTRGSLDKTITILMKIWINVPSEFHDFRNEGLNLLKALPRENHSIVHWGMVMSVYPFWAAVATQTGRLLKLQGHATASQVQRRVREQYGERETVSRRVRYVLRSFVDWGVLNETTTKGVYDQGRTISVVDQRLSAWMVEALLLSRANGSAPINDLINSPSIFPFQLAHISVGNIVSIAPRLDVLRHGLDDEIVMLK